MASNQATIEVEIIPVLGDEPFEAMVEVIAEIRRIVGHRDGTISLLSRIRHMADDAKRASRYQKRLSDIVAMLRNVKTPACPSRSITARVRALLEERNRLASEVNASHAEIERRDIAASASARSFEQSLDRLRGSEKFCGWYRKPVNPQQLVEVALKLLEDYKSAIKIADNLREERDRVNRRAEL